MPDAEVQLLRLLQIPSVERNKGVKLLFKILENIVSHLNETKYQDLKYNKIQSKFIKCKPCIDLLFCVGFEQSMNKKRLIWKCNHGNLHALKHVINTMKLNFITTDPKISDEKKDACVADPIWDTMTKLQQDNQLTYISNSVSNKYENMYNPCNRSECLCLAIITNILSTYKNMDKNNNYAYDAVDLLNKFNHLLSNHSHQFQQIYDILNNSVYDSKGCRLAKCVWMRRNQRDREQISKNEY
eukprot:163378_1